jgi:hypothetical protein
MSTAISDEPRLVTISDCLDELKKCIHWERHHQHGSDEWLRQNPDRNVRVMLAVVGYWRDRRQRVEERFKELNDLSRA